MIIILRHGDQNDPSSFQAFPRPFSVDFDFKIDSFHPNKSIRAETTVEKFLDLVSL
jgi:hypothetical protein